MGEASITEGTFGSAAREACADLANDLISSCGAIGWTFGVRSGQLNKVQREYALIEPITLAEVRSGKPGSQRRRTGRT